MKTKKKGISLIVLVITIIVMIILSASIILSLTGNNVIQKADYAKDEQDKSAMKERIMMLMAEAKLNNESIDSYISKDGYFSATKDDDGVTHVYRDGYEYTITEDEKIHEGIMHQSNVVEEFKSGKGTAQDPYIITNYAQMRYLAQLSAEGKTSGKYYKLGNDIELGAVIVNGEVDKSTSVQWNPISKFSGTFDGAGYSLKKIYINKSTNNVGVFSKIESTSATIKNLTVSQGYIKGAQYVGGIVGHNFAKIENCLNAIDVEGTYQVGGLAGYNFATITGCSNLGVITAKYQKAGGIVGQNLGALIEKCKNTGEVSAPQQQVGGIVGVNVAYNSKNPIIRECENYGSVTGRNAGGITGSDQFDACLTERCYNSGTIYALEANLSWPIQVAGITGAADSLATTKDCYNCGKFVVAEGDKVTMISFGAVQENCYYLKDDDMAFTPTENVKETTTKYNSLAEFLEALDAGTIN